jgi:hypothetical protein
VTGGWRIAVDLDLAKFFDNVDHDLPSSTPTRVNH